jgi:WD40 repeat protein
LQLLASGSDDGTVRIWKVPHQATASLEVPSSVAVLRGHVTNVFSSTFLPDTGDARVFTGGNDGTCRLFDVCTQTQLTLMVHHFRKVFAVVTVISIFLIFFVPGSLLLSPRRQYCAHLQL